MRVRREDQNVDLVIYKIQFSAYRLLSIGTYIGLI